MVIEDWKYLEKEAPPMPLDEDGNIDDNCDSMELLVVLKDGRVTTDYYGFHSPYKFYYFGDEVVKWTYLPKG